MTPEFARTTSHDFLRKHLMEINETLPQIQAINELSPQDARSVAIRSIILCHVVGIGFGADAKRLKTSLEKYELLEHASTKEQDLLGRAEWTKQEIIDATWQTECIQSLAWCLGLVNLDPFRHCDDNLASCFPPALSDPRNFISEAKLRPLDEIYQQADLHYRLHWAARSAQLTGRPSKIAIGIISERRKALDWTIGTESDWDEVPLDT